MQKLHCYAIYIRTSMQNHIPIHTQIARHFVPIAQFESFFTVLYSTYILSSTTLIVAVLYSFTEEYQKCCNTLYSVRAVAISLSGIYLQYCPTLFFNNNQGPRTKSWIKTRELGNEYMLHTPIFVWYDGCNLRASTSCHVG